MNNPSSETAERKASILGYQEWSDPYNSFNSLKGLLYRQWMEAVIEGRFLPPVEASIDPVYSCNLDCVWCNSQGILKQDPRAGKIMDEEHLLKLSRFLADWGVKGACYAGGGEPLLHPGCADSVRIFAEKKVDTAFLTNGILLDGEIAEAMTDHSRWVGVSLDSSNRDNYAQIKGVPPEIFDQALANLKALVKLRNRKNSRLEVSFKFLIHPDNAHTILEAAQLAKEIGVDYIHLRPAAAENVLGGADFSLDFPMELINQQLEKAFALEDDKFKVFGIRHKFSPRMKLSRRFSHCLAAPLLIQLGADGNCYLCVDHRGKPEYVIGRHAPDPEQIREFWGGEAMKKMMADVKLDKCPRCTFGIYNEIMEKTIIDDRMCKNFP